MAQLELMSLGRKTEQILVRWAEPVCRQYGLNHSELIILLYLANHPEKNTARDVCRLNGVKKGLVSITVDSLIQRGLLLRSSDPDDRRVHRLTLTEEAAPIVRDGQAVLTRFYSAVFSCLSDEETAAARAIMRKLLDRVEELEAGGITP